MTVLPVAIDRGMYWSRFDVIDVGPLIFLVTESLTFSLVGCRAKIRG